MPVLLMVVAGLLLGGAISLYRQGASKATVALLGILTALALAGGVLWLLPKGK